MHQSIKNSQHHVHAMMKDWTKEEDLDEVKNAQMDDGRERDAIMHTLRFA
jgi:hypothetical protein